MPEYLNSRDYQRFKSNFESFYQNETELRNAYLERMYKQMHGVQGIDEFSSRTLEDREKFLFPSSNQNSQKSAQQNLNIEEIHPPFALPETNQNNLLGITQFGNSRGRNSSSTQASSTLDDETIYPIQRLQPAKVSTERTDYNKNLTPWQQQWKYAHYLAKNEPMLLFQDGPKYRQLRQILNDSGYEELLYDAWRKAGSPNEYRGALTQQMRAKVHRENIQAGANQDLKLVGSMMGATLAAPLIASPGVGSTITGAVLSGLSTQGIKHANTYPASMSQEERLEEYNRRESAKANYADRTQNNTNAQFSHDKQYLEKFLYENDDMYRRLKGTSLLDGLDWDAITEAVAPYLFTDNPNEQDISSAIQTFHDYLNHVAGKNQSGWAKVGNLATEAVGSTIEGLADYAAVLGTPLLALGEAIFNGNENMTFGGNLIAGTYDNVLTRAGHSVGTFFNDLIETYGDSWWDKYVWNQGSTIGFVTSSALGSKVSVGLGNKLNQALKPGEKIANLQSKFATEIQTLEDIKAVANKWDRKILQGGMIIGSSAQEAVSQALNFKVNALEELKTKVNSMTNDKKRELMEKYSHEYDALVIELSQQIQKANPDMSLASCLELAKQEAARQINERIITEVNAFEKDVTDKGILEIERSANRDVLWNFALLSASEGFGGITTKFEAFKKLNVGKNHYSLREKAGQAKENVFANGLQYTKRVAETFGTEILQEELQEFGDKLYGLTADYNLNSYVFNKYYGDGVASVREQAVNGLESFTKLGADAWGQVDVGEIALQTFIGVGMGMPAAGAFSKKNREKMKKAEGESTAHHIARVVQQGLPWQTPWSNEIADIRSERAEMKEVIRDINERLQDPENASLLGGASAVRNFQLKFNKALSTGDEEGYENSVFGMLASEALRYEGARNSAYVRNKLQQLNNMADIRHASAADQQEAINAYRNSAITNEFKDKTDEEILTDIEEHAKKMLQVYNKTIEASDKLTDIFGDNLDDDVRRTLIFGKLAKENLAERISGNSDMLNRATANIINTVSSRNSDSKNANAYANVSKRIQTVEEGIANEYAIQHMQRIISSLKAQSNEKNPRDENGNHISKKQLKKRIDAFQKALKQQNLQRVKNQADVEKLNNQLANEDILLSESDIMHLDADARQSMIENKKYFSKEQQKVIDSLISQGLSNDELFLKRIHATGTQTAYAKNFEEQYNEALKNPYLLGKMIESLRTTSYREEKLREYSKLNDFTDYQDFVKAYRIAEETAEAAGKYKNLALNLLAETLEDNPLYKRYNEHATKINELTKNLKFSNFDNINEENKTKATTVIKFLDDNNVDFNNITQSIDYINDNLNRFQETIGQGNDVTNYIQQYREVMQIQNALEEKKRLQEEHDKALKESLERPITPKEPSQPAPQKAPESETPAPNKEEGETVAPQTPEKEYDMKEDETDLDYAKKVCPKEFHQYLEILNKYGEEGEGLNPFVLAIKTLLAQDVLNIDSDVARNLRAEVMQNLQQFLEELTADNPEMGLLNLFQNAATLIETKYTLLATPNVKDILSRAIDALSEDENDTHQANLNKEYKRTRNATSTTMTLANATVVPNSALNTQYIYYGIDEFLFNTSDRYLNRLKKERGIKIVYIVLPNDARQSIANSMGSNYIPEIHLPIAAAIELDAKEAERIKAEHQKDGTEKHFIEIKSGDTTRYFQPIGFTISSTSEAEGGNMSRIIRQTAIEQYHTLDNPDNPYVIKHDDEELFTTGMHVKGNSPFSTKAHSLKELVKQALKSDSHIWTRLLDGLVIGFQTDSQNRVNKHRTALYFTYYNGKKGSKDTVSKMQILEKDMMTVTNSQGRTLEDVINNGTIDDFIDFHKRDNGTQGRMYNAIKAVVDIAERYKNEELIVSESNVDLGNEAQKRVDHIWSAFKDYIYIAPSKAPFKTARDSNNNVYVYIEVGNTNSGYRNLKLFTVKNGDGTSVKMNQVASELREAMKDPEFLKVAHFQIDHYVVAQQSKEVEEGPITAATKAKEINRRQKAAQYLKDMVEDDVADIRAYSLLPTNIPVTHMQYDSYISNQLREYRYTSTEESQNNQDTAAETASTATQETTDPDIQSTSENPSAEAPVQPVEDTSISADEYSGEDVEEADSLDELRETTDTQQKLWNREKELTWLSKALPQLSRDNLIKFYEGLIRIRQSGKTAWGKFDGAMMCLSNLAAEGTVYHEAFHVVFRAVLDDTERAELLQEAKNKYGQSLDNAALTEAMAEDFRMYVQSYDKNDWRGKLKKFFEELFVKVTNWLTGRNKIEMLFQNINNGKFAERPLNLQKAEKLVNNREESFRITFDEDGNFANIESFINAVLETVLGYKDEHLAKLLTDNVNNEQRFNEILNEAIEHWDENLSLAINNKLSQLNDIDGSRNQATLTALDKFENGEKLTKAENRIIDSLIAEAGRTKDLNWISTTREKLRQSNTSTEDRLKLLSELKRMVARQSISSSANYKTAIQNALRQQRSSIANRQFNPNAIAEQLTVKEVASELTNIKAVFNEALNLENQAPDVLEKLKKKGISAIEYQSAPNELKERIKFCCNF